MAGHGREQNGNEKERAEQNAGFGRQSDQAIELGVNRHNNSPQFIIRSKNPGNFAKSPKACA